MSSDNEAASPAKEVSAPAHNNGEASSKVHESAAPLEATEEATAVEPETSLPTEAADEPQPESSSPTDSRSEEGEARSDDGHEAGDDKAAKNGHSHATTSSNDAPPLPNEPTPGGDASAPPLPAEAPPGQAPAESDDGWSAQWDATNQTWYFYNRFTGVSQWDNPRLSTNPSSSSTAAPQQPQISEPTSIAGGYNPAIHGSWDPNASYAQAYKDPSELDTTAAAVDEAEYQADLAMYNAEMDGSDPTAAAEGFGGDYASAAALNRRTGKTQAGDQNPERYSDANKSYRQMNAYFNVDQAANSHDGRSLKAERRGKQPTRKELSQWKEKRKARKEEKRRAWLRD